MSTQEAATQEATDLNEQRARYEQFSFRVPAPGVVNVANHSYGDENAGEHCYTVRFEAGEPAGCSCPHWEHREPAGGCKHMRTVEATECVALAASAEAPEGSA